MRLLCPIALAGVLLAAHAPASLGQPRLDDFLCYGTRGGLAISANLADVLDSGAYGSEGARLLCPPAGVDSGEIVDAQTHLKGYRLGGPHARRLNVPVENRFGRFVYDTLNTRTLMVPCAKSLSPDPPPAPPGATDVDYYRCVTIRRSPGAARIPSGLSVQVADQFGTRTTFVKRALKLCVATNNNGEVIKHPDRHLTCYRVEARPVTKVAGVQVNDQFGAETLALMRADELCVASTVALGSPAAAVLD